MVMGADLHETLGEYRMHLKLLNRCFLQNGLRLLSENNPLFSTYESIVVKGKKKKSDLDEIFKLVDHNLSQNATNGEIEPLKDFILPDLFVHQKQVLYWLYHLENSNELPPFWVENDAAFLNVLTN
ncbi:hypothetical protein L1987_21264 [Smallanthus sonchifolius]|uniref:Uncharacterized protein n=1 Tax=Smallanthus sonchifolius TaxID=185202 RepID=A0ACB9IVK1_9ASTR|nr:hypothetical protein L1987_21264 [Smallanthus sonchifolius]